MDDAHSSGGKVLVHCVAGMSRSVSLVLAYLVQREPRMRLAEALRLVKQKRTVVSPNPCFMEQLARFEVRRSGEKRAAWARARARASLRERKEHFGSARMAFRIPLLRRFWGKSC